MHANLVNEVNQALAMGSSLSTGPIREATCQGSVHLGVSREPEIADQIKQLRALLDELRDVAGMVEARFASVLSVKESNQANPVGPPPTSTPLGAELNGLRLGLRDVRDHLMSVVSRAEL